MKLLLLITLGFAATLADEFQVLKDFADGSLEFTINVYKELVKSNSGNFMVCPLSVEALLAFFHAGAYGATAQQISDQLNLPNDRATIDETFIKLSSQLKNTSDLISANKVYLNNGYQMVDPLKTTAANVFDIEIQNADMGKKQEFANEINHWIKNKTHNKINDLITQNDLENNSAAVLINAMYFRGKWMKKFSSCATTMGPFLINADNEIQVEMMEITDSFNVYVGDSRDKFLEIPYEGDDITMTIVLPYFIEGLSNLEEQIADVFVARKYRYIPSRVIIPKFKIETNIKFKPILQAMGLIKPFSNTADFRGFNVIDDRLVISNIIQKTFIEVDEGTTAGAETENCTSTLPLSSGRKFVVDHPFIYYLKIKGIVVFVGRYTGP